MEEISLGLIEGTIPGYAWMERKRLTKNSDRIASLRAEN
jgi:hypothetical protein